MRTLSEITLAVARLVSPESIVTGSATAGTTSSISDTANLTQPNSYFDKGTLWILSGTHAGEVYQVTGHIGNKLNFATVTGAIATGVRYAVTQNIYPYQQIKNAVMSALSDTHIDATDETLIGDGETLKFTLPTGVWDVKRILIKHPTTLTDFYESSHWKERHGKIEFDYGYAPEDDYIIRLVYRDQHPELVDYDDEISAEIDYDWLKYKAAEYLLNWGMGKYGAQAEYRIEERMGMVLEKNKRLTPRLHMDVIITTAGA